MSEITVSISLDLFKEFVFFVEKKIQPVARENENVRSIFQEIQQKAREIQEKYGNVDRDTGETAQLIQGGEDLVTQEATEPEEISTAPQEPQERERRVKRRRKRVRQKISQVCEENLKKNECL